MLPIRAESRDSTDYFSAYVNTHGNNLPDAGTRVLEVGSGAIAEARSEAYVDWASKKLPVYKIEDWTHKAGELIGRACAFGSLVLNEEPRSPAVDVAHLRT